MQRKSWTIWLAAASSAALLELPFPLAGPMPAWRGLIAYFGLIPLLWAVLSPAVTLSPRPLRRSFFLAYLAGVLWYMGNCYWIRNTMQRYGDMPPAAPELLLVAFSLVLGLYFGLFGLGIALVRRASSGPGPALAFAPVLWAAIELAAARITSVPWDQLGYSQVDNALVTRLAPFTGVYGISLLVVAVAAFLAGGLLLSARASRLISAASGAALFLVCASGLLLDTPPILATATATLVQPNLDVGGDNGWSAPGEWDRHIAQFASLAAQTCGPYLAGIPNTRAPQVNPGCYTPRVPPDLVVWPEAPSPFFNQDPNFQRAMASVARAAQAPLIVGGISADYSQQQQTWLDYNSAIVIAATGDPVGRYNKIHLVPFGEYIPFQRLLFFAHKLTGRVSLFTPGDMRKTFRLNGHRYGVFICYEAVFADEVRHFSELGAEVLVNISDDGWYGDTSAPWQHLNMARMRAVENRRWLLRDTNNGVTAVIDPYGRVLQSIPRHQVGALAAQFGFNDETTFYTRHGDVFAWLCVFASVAFVLVLALRARRSPGLPKS